MVANSPHSPRTTCSPCRICPKLWMVVSDAAFPGNTWATRRRPRPSVSMTPSPLPSDRSRSTSTFLDVICREKTKNKTREKRAKRWAEGFSRRVRREVRFSTSKSPRSGYIVLTETGPATRRRRSFAGGEIFHRRTDDGRGNRIRPRLEVVSRDVA